MPSLDLLQLVTVSLYCTHFEVHPLSTTTVSYLSFLFAMEFDTTKNMEHAYKPLRGPDHIRLISLRQALHPEEPLRFSFVTGNLLELDAQYKAISYTWGEPLLICPLYVDDGTHVKVTSNLDQALRRLNLEAPKP
jgi:hypothetical protein